jgi:DNA-binding winged helix-turn-helix (wHTH) protein/tetratricopeptide (TPR) repeat protein
MNQAPIELAHEAPFRIGAVEIRPATREIISGDRAEILEPRVMQVLVALHRAAGAVVSKSDLIQLCWEGRIVGEDAINRVLSRLRHDAEDKAGGAFRVETITRVGYRLVAADAPSGHGVAAPTVSRRRALAIAGSAAAVLGGSAVAWKLLEGPDIPPEAARLHEEGWNALLEGTVDQNANAAGKFRNAVEIAPDVAKLWGSLALAYQLQAQSSPGVQSQSLREKGEAAARRAFAIDPNDPDAIASGVMAMSWYRHWFEFERACRAALARAPHHGGINFALSSVLAQVGRLRDSLPYIERAVEKMPSAPRFQMTYATALWDLDRIEEAGAAFEKAFRLWPRHYAIWFTRYYFLTYSGRPQEALAMIADEATRPTGIPDWNFDVTALQAKAIADPQPATIDKASAAVLDFAKRGVGLAESAIRFFAAVNRMDDLFRVFDGYYFDRGFTLGEARYSKEQGIYAPRRQRHTFLLFVPRLANARRDPRFAPMLSELGLED